jgi:hypothetical protein
MKQLVISASQTILFGLLSAIGWAFVLFYQMPYWGEYRFYCFTHPRLIEFKTTRTNSCSNLINLPCSLQMYIDIYFFWSKFLLLYFLSIFIGTIYTWHRTVHFSHCVITLSVLADIIFRTDLVLYYDWIVAITPAFCLVFVGVFSVLEAFMPHISHDQLYTLCERLARPHTFDECLFDGHSKLARFYRWAMKMKRQWNIKEEKLIITSIVGMIASIILVTTWIFFIHFNSSKKDHICDMSKLI